MKCENPMVAVWVDKLHQYRFIGSLLEINLSRQARGLMPISNTHSEDRKYVITSCKECFACRLNRSREWAVRCVLHSRMYDEKCFITLTYDDQHLPSDLSLHHDHFQKFMKRLRKRTGLKIGYYMCGEYGELYNRPHYHAIIFGWDPKDKKLWSVRNGNNLYRSDLLEGLWPFGFSTVGEVTFDSAAYVARYVMKKVTGEKAEEVYSGRVPPYNKMSLKPGIGRPYLEKYGKVDYERDFVIIGNGMKAKIPTYFDKIYDDVFYGGFECFPAHIIDGVDGRRAKSDARFKLCPESFSLKRTTDSARAVKERLKSLKRSYVEE